MVVAVRVEADFDGWVCEVRKDGLRARVRLIEVSGRLSVKEVLISSVSPGAELTPSVASGAPYASWFRAAQDAVIRQQRADLSDDAAEVRPFLEDRRGKPPRSDQDYASLASLYVALGPGAARLLASAHGGSIQTWRNHLSKTKRFTHMVEREDPDGRVRRVRELTEQALELVYGDDPQQWEDREVSEVAEAYRDAVEFIRVMENPQKREERDRRALILQHQSRAEIEERLRRSKQIVAARER